MCKIAREAERTARAVRKTAREGERTARAVHKTAQEGKKNRSRIFHNADPIPRLKQMVDRMIIVYIVKMANIALLTAFYLILLLINHLFLLW